MSAARTRSTGKLADRALIELEVDAAGLDAMDRRYLIDHRGELRRRAGRCRDAGRRAVRAARRHRGDHRAVPDPEGPAAAHPARPADHRPRVQATSVSPSPRAIRRSSGCLRKMRMISFVPSAGYVRVSDMSDFTKKAAAASRTSSRGAAAACCGLSAGAGGKISRLATGPRPRGRKRRRRTSSRVGFCGFFCAGQTSLARREGLNETGRLSRFRRRPAANCSVLEGAKSRCCPFADGRNQSQVSQLDILSVHWSRSSSKHLPSGESAASSPEFM